MRLIDSDEASRLFGKEYEEMKELIHNGETQLDSLAEGFTEAYHIIKYVLPTVDAVPVVRCEDCTNGIKSDDNKYIICCRLGVGMEFDDFCSHGEGKNGGSGYATD